MVRSILVAICAGLVVLSVGHAAAEGSNGEQRVSAAMSSIQRLCPSEMDNVIGPSVQRMNDVAMRAGATAIVMAESSPSGLLSAYQRIARQTPGIDGAAQSFAAIEGMASGLSLECREAFLAELE